MKAFRCSATTRKSRVVCGQIAHDKYYRHDCMDCHTNTMPLPEELDPNECINSI